MSKESFCLQVPKTSGEKALAAANKLGLTEKALLIRKEVNLLCIPISREPYDREIVLLKEQVPDLRIFKDVFAEKKGQPKTLLEALEETLAPHLLAVLPRALDVVGDIAIVEVPPELESHKTVIGEAILKVHTNIHVVLAKAGKVSGTFRLREFEFIAGERRTATLYKENACSYYVDVGKAYFSPRLSHEHDRVALQVGEGEVVVDLFAGVGPFAVPIAKKKRTVKVYAIDINADAVELLKRNLRVNRVENRVFAFAGDARQIVNEKLAGTADRVIMNLPESAIEFVDVACKSLKLQGGTVHFYGFVRAPETMSDLKMRFAISVEKAGRKLAGYMVAKPVRETAPYEQQVVLDAKIR